MYIYSSGVFVKIEFQKILPSKKVMMNYRIKVNYKIVIKNKNLLN